MVSKTPTTVWVVQEMVPHEGDYLVDIFATKEAAEAYVRRMPEYRRHDFVIDDWEVRE